MFKAKLGVMFDHVIHSNYHVKEEMVSMTQALGGGGGGA